MPMTDLLNLPERAAKPRQQGLTHVLDRGLSVADVDNLAEVAGDYIDVAKLGWGTSVATGNLQAKLERYRHHGITAMFGGTLTELAIAQNRLDALVAWLHELGLEHIEVSDGTITLEHERKVELIERLAKEFTVLSDGVFTTPSPLIHIQKFSPLLPTSKTWPTGSLSPTSRKPEGRR